MRGPESIRPKEVVAHWILQSGSLSNRESSDGAAEVFEGMYIGQVGTID